MSAYYDLYQNPPAQGKKEEVLPSFHARIVSCGTVDTDAIARDIEANTSFTYGDVVGVLGCLQQELIKRLSDGYQVNLDGLGIFSAGLKCSPVTDKKEVRSRDVQLSDIHFRPAVEKKPQTGYAAYTQPEQLGKRYHADGKGDRQGVGIPDRTQLYRPSRGIEADRIQESAGGKRTQHLEGTGHIDTPRIREGGDLL